MVEKYRVVESVGMQFNPKTFKQEVTRKKIKVPKPKKKKKSLRELKKVPTRLKGTKQPRFSTSATKLTQALMPSVATGSQTESVSGRGRGRPPGTFKARYLPDGRIVRVPTHIYRKMLAEVKAKRRLAAAQRQAQMQAQAEQIAMQQDPRFQGGGEDDMFLAEPDMEHEQRVSQYQQEQAMMQQMPEQGMRPQGEMVQRLKRLFGGRGTPQQGDIYGTSQTQNRFAQPFTPRDQQRYQQAYQEQSIRSEPKVRAISDKSSILRTGSNLLQREERPIGFGRR